MCVKIMVNDGGLCDVFRTSDRVASSLSSLTGTGHGVCKNDVSARSGVKRKPSRSLSEVTNTLAHHSTSELKQVVAPLVRELKKLDAAALLSLNPTKNGRGATLDPNKGLTVPPIHDRIAPRCKDRGDNVVRYLHVKEASKKYSVGIFVFPPGAEIPLHDHPSMIVISRVLYGELQVKSFDVLPQGGEHLSSSKRSCSDSDSSDEPPPARPASTFRSSFNRIKEFVARTFSYQESEGDVMPAGSVLHVKPNLKPMGVQMPPLGDCDSSATLTAPNVTCLYPLEGNCHSFVAGPDGAAVIDVLLPPYDPDEDRDCTFYRASEDDGEPGATGQNQDNLTTSYTLTPTEPEDFHCLSGSYGRFGACKEYSDDSSEDRHEVNSSCSLS
ncbi:hypothetical protein ACHAWF_001444 [Thalassiosira exigua]